jgi:predicted HTH transcriptional regulator
VQKGHDAFDRKSGRLLSDQDFEKDLGKELSDFANSGGGHLLLGVKDEGAFDGVPVVNLPLRFCILPAVKMTIIGAEVRSASS